MGRACAVVAALVCCVVWTPSRAQACGGLFCSASQPVSQAGEVIVFAVEEDGTVTAHVRIRYQGAAPAFSWILPVPAVPEVSLGVDELFSQLDAATAPRFVMTAEVRGTCGRAPSSCGDDRGRRETGVIVLPDGGSTGSEGSVVDVARREVVGPYDMVVLGSDDPDALRAWLADNGYDVPDAALPLLDYYVAKNDLFVALKLLPDASVGDIRPIALRFAERQPCIPIRLTSISTVPDMPITVYVLGRARAVSYNYMGVVPNLDDMGLFGGDPTDTYRRLVSQAVNDAGGRGFVTEYAGAVPRIALDVPSIESLRTVTDVRLMVQGVTDRLGLSEQVSTILARHLPPPDGVSATQFYGCLARPPCGDFDDYVMTLSFDPDALIDELDAVLVAPGRETQAMVDRHGELTRLFTTISAHEMTEDPLFTLREGMPEVSNVHTATLVTECSSEYALSEAPQRVVFESGAELVVREGTRLPRSRSCGCAVSPSAGGMGAPLGLLLIAVLLGLRRNGAR